jgi:hypothetical protein
MVTIDVTPYCGASLTKDIEILAVQLYKNRNEKINLSLGAEGFDITFNGLEQAVKNIADYIEIPYDQISFTTNDRLAKSQFFKNTYVYHIGDELLTVHDYFPRVTFPVVKKYAQLLARPDSLRLYGHYKHLNNRLKKQGIATCHCNIETFNETKSEFTDFILEFNEFYRELLPTLPYSDIGEYLQPPIIHGNRENLQFWNDLYSQVAVELVYETVTTSDTFFITEKTYRPIQYGKLFMIVGSNNFEQRLRDLGFDIFDDIIDKSYDSDLDYIRVDNVYKSLNNFLLKDINLNNLKFRLENNQKRLNDMLTQERTARVQVL